MHIIYSYLRKRDEDEWRYFDTWKFGKLYKYFNRQREIVNRRYEDIKNAVIKDYSNEISDIDKLRIILDAFRANTKLSKEELKKEVDALLA